MDARLRKRHKFIWMILAPVMVVLIVLALKDLSFSPNATMKVYKNESGKILKQVENEEIQVFLIENSGISVLQVKIKSPLRATSSILYALTGSNKTESLLGQLSGMGTYSFPVDDSIGGILIEDRMKSQQILKLEF